MSKSSTETKTVDALARLKVAELVPHRASMCLLDSVVDAGADWLIAKAEIRADNIFCLPAGVPTWIGIEYMAQTIAALAGLRELQQGSAVKLGFLLGTRKYSVNQPYFTVGSILKIKVEEVILGENGLGAFDCQIESDANNCKAEGSLNVFQPPNPEEFLSRGKLS